MTHDYSRLLGMTEPAFEAAVQDVEDAAKAEAEKHSRTGKFKDSITHTVGREGDDFVARVGSPLVSARVKEKGGFMQSNSGRGLLLRLPGGEYRTVQQVRVRATPVMAPAGAKFAEDMTRRMRERTGGA